MSDKKRGKDKITKKPFYKKAEWLIPIILSLLLALFFGGKYMITIDSPENFTGNYCKDCKNVVQSFFTNDLFGSGLTTTVTITNNNNIKENNANWLIILPDDQRGIVKKYKPGNTIEFARCDPSLKLCSLNEDFWLTNGEEERYAFINYSQRYLCENESSFCNQLVNKIALETPICAVLFTKGLNDTWDRLWLTTYLNKNCTY